VEKAQKEPISLKGVDESVEPVIVPRQFVELAPESIISNCSVHAELTMHLEWTIRQASVWTSSKHAGGHTGIGYPCKLSCSHSSAQSTLKIAAWSSTTNLLMLILGRACKPREYSLSASSMARQAPLHWRASDLDLAAFLCLCHAMNLRGSSGRFLGESLKHLLPFNILHSRLRS